MRLVRIVFLNPVAEFGGAERSLVAWMAAVRHAYPSAVVTLIVPGEGLLAEHARGLGATVSVLPVPAALAHTGDSALQRGGRARPFARTAGRAVAALPAAHGYVRRLGRALADLRPALVH